MHHNLQELVTKAAKGEKYDAEYDFVVSFYEGDVNPTQLRSQLQLLVHILQPKQIQYHLWM